MHWGPTGSVPAAAEEPLASWGLPTAWKGQGSSFGSAQREEGLPLSGFLR